MPLNNSSTLTLIQHPFYWCCRVWATRRHVWNLPRHPAQTHPRLKAFSFTSHLWCVIKEFENSFEHVHLCAFVKSAPRILSVQALPTLTMLLWGNENSRVFLLRKDIKNKCFSFVHFILWFCTHSVWERSKSSSTLHNSYINMPAARALKADTRNFRLLFSGWDSWWIQFHCVCFSDENFPVFSLSHYFSMAWSFENSLNSANGEEWSEKQ